MKPIIIANWKASLELSAASMLAEKIDSMEHSSQFLLAPPAPYLAYFAYLRPKIDICAQDVSAINGLGAFTGETPAQVISSCGVRHAIIGHSEKRAISLETNHIIRQKIENCVSADITPIVCIGENLESRQNNNYKEFLSQQLKSLPNNLNKLILAYEPSWAIGTGISPTTEEISEIIELIKNYTDIMIVAKNVQLVYGGSVSSKNFTQIMKIPNLSGVLVGTAALNNEELGSIFQLIK
jgi:triosephosphate isomerase